MYMYTYIYIYICVYTQLYIYIYIIVYDACASAGLWMSCVICCTTPSSFAREVFLGVVLLVRQVRVRQVCVRQVVFDKWGVPLCLIVRDIESIVYVICIVFSVVLSFQIFAVIVFRQDCVPGVALLV